MSFTYTPFSGNFDEFIEGSLKISQLPPVIGAVSAEDVLAIVNAGETRKITVAQLTALNSIDSSRWDSTFSTVTALSGNWEGTYTTVRANSAQWASNIDTGVRLLTSNWQSTFSTVSSLSTGWQGTYTTVSANSAKWEKAFEQGTHYQGNSATFALKTSLTDYLPLIGGTVTGNLLVNGNFFVVGTATNIQVDNLNISDSLIHLASGNPADVLDIGFVGSYTEGTKQNTGLVRDATDNIWTLFSGLTTDPISSTEIDFSDQSLKIDTLRANLAGGTLVFGDLSASGNVSAANLNIKDWDNTSTIVKNNSANWISTFNTVSSLSSNWQSTYRSVCALSANWQSTFNTVSSLSSNWQSTYAAVCSLSSRWEAGFGLISAVRALSGNWQSAFVTVSSLSAGWQSTYATVCALSSNWQSTYNTVSALSANWESTYATVCSLSSGWQSAFIDLSTIKALSGNWQSTYATVCTLSSNWQSTFNTVSSLSSNWQSTYATVCALSSEWSSGGSALKSLSGNWQSTYLTVCALSSNWNSAYNDLTALKALSGNWQSTYVTVCSLSSNWNLAYRGLTALQALSSNWQSTYATVCSLSTSWGSGLGTLSALQALSGNWQSTYATVCSLSSEWNSGGSALRSLSGNWQSTYVTVCALSSGWELGKNFANYLPLSGGTITGTLAITGTTNLSGNLIVRSGQNVGIGTNSPNQALTVMGSVCATQFVYKTNPIFITTSSPYTLTDTVRNSLILINRSLSSVVVVPPDTSTFFVSGGEVNITGIGTGIVYVSGGPGVTVRAPENRNRLRTQNSTATLVKLSANDWLLFGDIWL